MRNEALSDESLQHQISTKFVQDLRAFYNIYYI
jgi:hypothetical protein